MSPLISRIANCWKKRSPSSAGHKVEIFTPQRGQQARLPRSRRQQRQTFLRSALPRAEAQLEGDRRRLQNALNLLEEPKRIESFDISHMQGTDTVASMVVWENGRMKKSDYRKFIIRGEFTGVPMPQKRPVNQS